MTTQTPTDALRLVPHEKVRELAMQLARSIAGLGYPVGLGVAPPEDVCMKAAQGIFDLYLTAAPASPLLEGGGLEPLADDPAVAALCDSSYRAGALAGWNAANHSDPAEGERIMARIREVEPGSLAPILERNRLRKLPAAPAGDA